MVLLCLIKKEISKYLFSFGHVENETDINKFCVNTQALFTY